jgi:hypothetical protein
MGAASLAGRQYGLCGLEIQDLPYGTETVYMLEFDSVSLNKTIQYNAMRPPTTGVGETHCDEMGVKNG